MQKGVLEAKLLVSGKEMEEFDRFLEKTTETLNSSKPGNIHQCSCWGRFQAAGEMRDKFWCVGVKESGKMVASALVVKQKLPLGKCWMYVPRGPVMDYRGARAKEILAVLIGKIKELAKAEKAVFVRVDPGIVKKAAGTMEKSAVNVEKLLSEAGFRKAHAHYQPENTIMVDLNQAEEQILAQMKPKGRYNIKLAEKKGVKILMAGTGDYPLKKGVEEFYKLLNETTSRDGFSGHNQQYYLKMLEELGDYGRLYLAEFEGEIIAGIIDTFFGDLGIYYFGASGNKHRNVMAPYLLQWEALKEAKRRGIRWYDFLGVAPEGAGKEHPWAGVTEFKEKFGGSRIDYLPAQELVFDKPMFWLMRAGKSLKQLLRRLRRN
jgi:lipid II:glycine glycyltransferase (peptidoglycan interpeptide bridge formation enzyme)